LSLSGETAGVQLAINHDSGNLLVVDNWSHAILQMDESGAPVPFTHPALAGATALDASNVPSGMTINADSDIAVDNTSTASQGNIYLVTTDSVPPHYVDWEYRFQGFKASGELLFDVTLPGRAGGLGIAPDGDVWLGVDKRMAEFTPAGTPTGSAFDIPLDVIGFDTASQSEFDAAGNMYIYLAGSGRVMRRSPSGKYRILATESRGLALDPATGNVVSARPRDNVLEIDQYGPDGQLEGATGAGIITSTIGGGSLALSKDGRTLFWVDSATIAVFGPAIRRPEADAASSVGTMSATLSGVVSPGGLPTTYQFELGTTKSLGSVAPSSPVDAGSGMGPVTADTTLTGLKPQTFYYYRLKATVGGTEVYGPIRAFRTGEPSAVLSGVGDLGPSSATMSGTVDSYDLGAATYHFLVEGVGTSFSTVSAELPVPAGSGPRTVTAPVAGLPSGQRFTARLIATAGGAITASAPVSFQTPELPALLRAAEPSSNPAPYGCVSCGRSSNRVEPAATPSNVFRLGASAVKGSSAAVAVGLPGAGTVVSTGKYLVKSTVKVKKAGGVSVQLRLTAAGKRALAKSRSGALKVTVRVRYTPVGGSGRTLSKVITFKRGGSR
jgi:hypothetical protein